MNSLSLPLFIALRFLFRARADKPLTLFTLVSIAGIAASVLIFLLIDTVMNGFAQRLSETLLGFEAPVTMRVTSGSGEQIQKQIAVYAQSHQNLELQWYGGNEFYGLIRRNTEMPMGIKVRTVGSRFFQIKGSQMPIKWLSDFDVEKFLQAPDAVVVGADIFKSLSFVEDEMPAAEIIHPFAELGPSGDLEPRVKSFKVAGILTTGYYDIDKAYVFLSEASLFGFADTALMQQFYSFYSQRLESADALQKSLNQSPLKNFGRIESWVQKNKALFKAMQLERIVFTILFFLLVVISCLNLTSIIRIFGINKLKDTAVLRALGSSHKLLYQIYGGIGFLLGVVGGGVGVGLGGGLIAILGRQGLHLPEAYGLANLPLAVNPWTVLSLLLAAPLLSMLVALWPAHAAIRATVIEVLRDV